MSRNFPGSQTLTASDAGFPADAVAGTHLFWFRTTQSGVGFILTYGSAINPGGGRVNYANSGAVAGDTYGVAVSGGSYADNAWHKAVVVFSQDGSGLTRVFVDGADVGSGTITTSAVLGGVVSVGGFFDGSGPNRFIGDLANIGIFATALSDVDAAALSNNATPDHTSAANCVSFWALSSPSDLADTSGNGNNLVASALPLGPSPWNNPIFSGAV